MTQVEVRAAESAKRSPRGRAQAHAVSLEPSLVLAWTWYKDLNAVTNDHRAERERWTMLGPKLKFMFFPFS